MRAKQHGYYKVGTNKGVPRIWLQGGNLTASNFHKGQPFETVFNIDTRTIVLRLLDTPNENCRFVSGRVNNKTKIVTPIIELAKSKLIDITGQATKVRVDFYENEIHISIHHLDCKIEEREARLKRNVTNGEITKGVVCVGIGVSAAAGHDALSSQLHCKTKFVVDRERKYLDLLTQNNHAIDGTTKIFEASLEEIEPELLDYVDILSFSLPCSGMSLSGRSKNRIKIPEEHATDATAVFGLIKIIDACNPSILVSENVVPAMHSATYVLLKSLLAMYGYNIAERTLSSEQTNSFENRERYWFVATSQNLPTVDLANFPKFAPKYSNLASLLDCIPHASNMWKSTKEKIRKAAVNKAAGKGFGFNLVDPNITQRIGTIGKGYQKDRATECHIAGPNNTMRLLTPSELARAQSVPAHLIQNVCDSTAYEGLGQGVDFLQAFGIFQCLLRDVLTN
ncbi:DNA cytosine methyltransferase [Shewanella aestuarii]|uniref:DNA (cytosine-5-)-methyltransferase n=1 Tax=Shewanella aestuarii TaxID=1028752 RepID=A0A6G9QRL1_9GAMM|nr:DNA cytosine methyltransferase [Shewanella aestuarii]QIR16667.1 DNA cytosine methyltransferase [Shewanella aestuarii]